MLDDPQDHYAVETMCMQVCDVLLSMRCKFECVREFFLPFYILLCVVELFQRLLTDLSSVEVKYRKFGVQLGIAKHKIDGWEMQQQKNPGLIFMDILDFWLHNYVGDTPRDELCKALEGIDELVLAKDIKKKYTQQLGM